jgi:hypothetical protein
VSRHDDCQHHQAVGDQERRYGKTDVEELLKTVMFKQPKMLTGCDQQVRGQVWGLQRSPTADVAPPVERLSLTLHVHSHL